MSKDDSSCVSQGSLFEVDQPDGDSVAFSLQASQVNVKGCSVQPVQLSDGTQGFRFDVPDADIGYFPNWLNTQLADDYFLKLRHSLLWQQSDIRLYGRWQKIPRLNCWYGDPGSSYQYSGKQFEPLAWTPELAQLKQKLADSGMVFNSVLANCYRDGADSVAWHSDDEPELGQRPLIASISLGQSRRFHLKHKMRSDLSTVIVELQPGSLLIMGGLCQSHWRHQIPKTQREVQERINLTFRRVVR